jgi:SAM-dependent methyltransferase
VQLHPALAGQSTKPVIGPLIALLKRGVFRLLYWVLEDIVTQTNATLANIERAMHSRDGQTAAIEQRLLVLDEQLSGVSDRATAAEERLARLEQRLAEHEAGEEGSRLAQGPLEYQAFEDRFRPEGQVKERQRIYRDALVARKRVVDLGCGRGELLELLRDLDVSAYGVEVDAGFVAHARAKGVEVVQEEAVAHLQSLDRGAVDTIFASHLIEHLPATSLFQLIELAAEKLDQGGLVIFETPNPTSLLAGSVNFYRDPTHLHPIHPDTLVFLCERAGFTAIEVWPLVPVPAELRLPGHAPGEGELVEHVDAVVSQLNELLYGHQDYALFAWT